MIAEALAFVAQGVAGAVQQFQALLDGIPGFQGIILSSVTMYMAVRFLLRPFLGSSMGSDSVKKKKAKEG